MILFEMLLTSLMPAVPPQSTTNMVLDNEQHKEGWINPVYATLSAVESKLSEADRISISEAIYRCSTNNNVRWTDLVSIAKIESNLNPKAIRKVDGRSVDHGLFQINIVSIKHFNFDKTRMLEPKYNVDAACKVISYVKGIRSNWIGYYNVGPYSKNDARRLAYENKVKSESYIISKMHSKMAH